jgi:hypothetical protein
VSHIDVNDQHVTLRAGILTSISQVFLADDEVTQAMLSRFQSVMIPEMECTPSTVNSSALGLHWNVALLVRKSMEYKEVPNPNDPLVCRVIFAATPAAMVGRTYDMAADHRHMGLLLAKSTKDIFRKLVIS